MEDEMKCDYTSDDEDKLTEYVMYKIRPKNMDLKSCYVGHTNNFNSRKNHHKIQAINITPTGKKNETNFL